MITLSQQNSVLDDVCISDFYSDGLRISADGVQVTRIRSTDTLPLEKPELDLAKKAHRDHIQLLPRVTGVHNQQYCGAELSNIMIRDCRMTSPTTQAQGVFCSDGLLSEINIFYNELDLGSQHKIMLNGLLSGWIADNRDKSGKLVRIELNPLRLLGGFNVWILGFVDCRYQYQPVHEIVRDSTLDHVIDNRQRITRPGDMYLTDFDLQGFKDLALCTAAPDAQTLCRLLYAQVEQFGRRVYAV